MVEVNPNVMCGISPKWPEAKSTIHAAVSAMQIPVRPDHRQMLCICLPELCCINSVQAKGAETLILSWVAIRKSKAC